MADGARRMERLLLPRARAEPSGIEQPLPESKNPLPKWQTVPLDSKFPVLPAPKGEVTFVTTKLGEPRFKSKQREDFDLSDPLGSKIKSDYSPFFDPFLKGWFARPSVQQMMRENELVTEDGKVPVSLREFNDYRRFLRQQAVLVHNSKAGIKQGLEMAQTRRKENLAKTKMKAEVFGLEVKYKSLKAQQAAREEEEERRLKYMQKQEGNAEKQRAKEEEQQKVADKLLKKKIMEFMSKKDKMKELEEKAREKANKRLLQFEINAQDKLNKIDYLREQRFQRLDQRRKFRWRARRLGQMQELAEEKRQRQRVDAEMRTLKRRYEDKIRKQMAKNEVALDIRKEMRHKQKEENKETYARRMARVLKDTRYMTFSNFMPNQTVTVSSAELSRKASVWMVQEVLQRLGLTEESRRLAKEGLTTMSYLFDMDSALGTVVKRLEGVTMLGPDQELLSRLVHLIWRKVKAAYPGKPLPSSKVVIRDEVSEADLESRQLSAINAGKSVSKVVAAENEGAKDELTKNSPSSRFSSVLAERKIMEDTGDEDATTAEELARFFPDEDDGEEREKAIKISMLVTGEMNRNQIFSDSQRLGEPHPSAETHSSITEENMDEFFRTQMRMTETDALAVEAELLTFLESLKANDMKPKLMKQIMTMCLKLVNHDVIEYSDPCGELETNPYGKVYMAFEEASEATKSAKSGQPQLNEEISKSVSGSADKREEPKEEDATAKEIESAALPYEAEVVPEAEETAEAVVNNDANNDNIYAGIMNQQDNQRRVRSSRRASANTVNMSRRPSGNENGNNTPSGWGSGYGMNRSQNMTEDETEEGAEGGGEEARERSEEAIEGNTTIPELRTETEAEDIEEDTAPTAGLGPEEEGQPIQENSNMSIPIEKHPAIAMSASTMDEEPISPEKLREMREENQFNMAIANDDMVTATTILLARIQNREKSKGVSIPNSRLLRYIAVNMSKMWKRKPEDTFHRFGNWLLNPSSVDAIRSLIFNIKRRCFPIELQRTLAKAIVSKCLDGVSYEAMPLTDGLVRAILERFLHDLEADEVSMSVLENVLQAVTDEYSQFSHMNVHFNCSLMLIECLEYTKGFLASGSLTKRGDILPAIKNWSSLGKDAKESLECGHWPGLLHRSSVLIRLNALTEGDDKKLQNMLFKMCAEFLGPEYPNKDIKEMLAMMRNRLTLPKYQCTYGLKVAVNTVVILMDALDRSKVTSTTLLPGGRNISQSHCTNNSASVLGPYTSAEAVVLLHLDKFASDLGNGNLEDSFLRQMAASMIEVLVSQYGKKRDHLKAEGLTAALQDITQQFSSYVFGFQDAKRLLAALLRPSLAATAKVVATEGSNREPVPSLDKTQTRLLKGLITQIFVTFITGIRSKLQQSGVKVEVTREIMSLYTWRALAKLAHQAKSVLQDITVDRDNSAESNRVKPSDSLIIETMIRSVVDVKDGNGNNKPHTDAGENNTDMFSRFLYSVIDYNSKPGYIPVPDTHNSKDKQGRVSSKKNSKLQETSSTRDLRGKATPPDLDRALRRELIAAARDLCDNLVSSKALKQLSAKTADNVAGMVFVLEQFLSEMYNKLWSVRIDLQRGRIAPADLNTTLIGPHKPEEIPQFNLTRKDYLRGLNEAINEIEAQHTAAISMSRLVESLSRAAYETISAKNAMKKSKPPAATDDSLQPHPILCSASPVLLSQWVRSCLLSSIGAASSALSGGLASPQKVSQAARQEGHEENRTTKEKFTEAKPSRPRPISPEAVYMACAYTCIHNVIAGVRDSIEENKTTDGLWHAPCVADSTETSQVGVPIEILDRVFARVAGIMQTFGEASTVLEPGENDGRIPDSPSELASTIIKQVTSAMTYHVELGNFPVMHPNDIVNGKAKGKGENKESKKPKGKNVSENNKRGWNVSHNNLSGPGIETSPRHLCDPVDMLESRCSSHLFHGLEQVLEKVDNELRFSIEESVRTQANKTERDAKVKARAFTSAWLNKVRKNSNSQDILLTHTIGKKVPMAPAPPPATRDGAPVRRAAAARRGPSSANTNVNKSSDGEKQLCVGRRQSNDASSVSQYIKSLIESIQTMEPVEPSSYKNDLHPGSPKEGIVDVLVEILQAGYSVSLDLLRSFESCDEAGKLLDKLMPPGQTEGSMDHSQRKSTGGKNSSLCVLLLDLLLAQVASSVSKQGRGTGAPAKKAAAALASPYVSSIRYRQPDPLGQFYAEVVSRGRRWGTNVVDATTAHKVVKANSSAASLGSSQTSFTAPSHTEISDQKEHLKEAWKNISTIGTDNKNNSWRRRKDRSVSTGQHETSVTQVVLNSKYPLQRKAAPPTQDMTAARRKPKVGGANGKGSIASSSQVMAPSRKKPTPPASLKNNNKKVEKSNTPKETPVTVCRRKESEQNTREKESNGRGKIDKESSKKDETKVFKISNKPQNAKIEVIYHVNEENKKETEENLKKLAEMQETEIKAPALREADLQQLVLSLLSNDLPAETSILQACMQGQGHLKLSSLADATDLLSLLDKVLAELSTVEKVEEVSLLKTKRLLNTLGNTCSVSQRSTGAVHCLLRSVESGLLPDSRILSCLPQRGSKAGEASKLDLCAVKAQLKSELAEVVERLEEGHTPECVTSAGWDRLAAEIFRQVVMARDKADSLVEDVDTIQHDVQVTQSCNSVSQDSRAHETSEAYVSRQRREEARDGSLCSSRTSGSMSSRLSVVSSTSRTGVTSPSCTSHSSCSSRDDRCACSVTSEDSRSPSLHSSRSRSVSRSKSGSRSRSMSRSKTCSRDHSLDSCSSHSSTLRSSRSVIRQTKDKKDNGEINKQETKE